MNQLRKREVEEALSKKKHSEILWKEILSEVNEGKINKEKIVHAMDACNCADQFCLMKKIDLKGESKDAAKER